ncbi:MAG: hypothetical protein HXY46_05390 [Syntrophaceae bacterium]|nr:hypothetical protein [Syntrophaceae bacterium]
MPHKEGPNSRLCSSLLAIILGASGLISGCSAISGSVIASTGTTIGVEITQDQATQTPRAVLGYKRAEFAYVPTNRGTAKKTTTTVQGNTTTTVTEDGLPASGGGARDSANVLMELRYSGIFDWGSGSGIYQRLAVGDEAVRQPGASFMFMKDSKGQIQADTAKYLALAQKAVSLEKDRIEKIVSYVTDGSDAINKETLSDLLKKAEKEHPLKITSTVKDTIMAAKTGAELRKKLFDPLESAIEPLYLSLPKEKQ